MASSTTPGSVPPRLFIDKQTPQLTRALNSVALRVSEQAAAIGLDRRLIELVNVRVSQINGCAYCLRLHVARALEAGETADRLAVLPAWRETGLFSDKERAALTLAESTTLVATAHLDDAEYEWIAAVLTPDELSVVSWAAIAINAFNRVSILSRHPVTGE